MTEIIGLIVAVAPTVWMYLFGREPGVIAAAFPVVATLAGVTWRTGAQ